MTAEVDTPHQADEPWWWTRYPDLDTAAHALQRPVAHLPGRTPVTIGCPAAEHGKAPTHIWVRYQDPDGATHGVVTLARPRELSVDGHPEAISVAVGTMLQAAGRSRGAFAPDNEVPSVTCTALTVGGAAYRVVSVCIAPAHVTVAALLPDGAAVARWGPEFVLDRELALTARP